MPTGRWWSLHDNENPWPFWAQALATAFSLPPSCPLSLVPCASHVGLSTSGRRRSTMAELKCLWWEYAGFAMEASTLTEQVLTGQRDDADIDPTLSSRSAFRPQGQHDNADIDDALFEFIVRPHGQLDDGHQQRPLGDHRSPPGAIRRFRHRRRPLRDHRSPPGTERRCGHR